MPTLQFKGKSVIETYHHTVPHHRLEFDPKLSLLPKGEKPGLDGNLIIEGDNLLALKALLPTHAGKVKCIYIDPPYNTGEVAWVYNDNLSHAQFKEWIGKEVGTESEDACRHDKWCCMMYPRLTLLRELLRDDGALFVSIDENEHGFLRVMLDEVFRVEMPIATFVWKRRSATGMRDDPVSVDHEYVLLYAKNPSAIRLEGLVCTADDYPLKDDDGRFASTDLTIGATEEERPNQAYTIKHPRRGTPYPHNPERVWRFEPEEMKVKIRENLIIWPDDFPELRMTRPRFKTYFDPLNPRVKPVSSWIQGAASAEEPDEENGNGLEVIASGLNSEGGRVLRRIFGKKVFNYPKPPSLVKSLLKIATGKDDLVLDSFAGSGTTGHSVLELNAETSGNRKFILVQLRHDSLEQTKEKLNVCKEVTAKRIRSLVQGYSYAGKGSKTIDVPGLQGSFTYARVGDPLFSEYRDLGKALPTFEDLAKYIFYTETSHDCDLKKVDADSGFIGEVGGKSYYLLYTPNDREDREASLKSLDRILKKDKNRSWVIYTERIWMHQDDLRKFERENGRSVRLMLVPFNLK